MRSYSWVFVAAMHTPLQLEAELAVHFPAVAGQPIERVCLEAQQIGVRVFYHYVCSQPRQSFHSKRSAKGRRP